MVEPNDWRIASGQERWCRGLVFKWSRWAPTATISYKPDGTTEPAIWSHDHCEFCWRDVSDTDYDCGDGSRALLEGWAARGPAGRPDEQRRDNYHWVCPTCFEDFKDLCLAKTFSDSLVTIRNPRSTSGRRIRDSTTDVF